MNSETVAPVAALPVVAWRQKSYWQGESSDSYRWCYSESNPGTEAEALCDHTAATQRIAAAEARVAELEADATSVRAALQELVRLETQHRPDPYQSAHAWDAARAALSQPLKEQES